MVIVTVIVMAMVVMGMVVMGMRRMRVIAVIVMLDLIAARVARMRPEQRDQAGQDGAQQRQKDDCLNHGGALSPSSD
jgi:hypothetical protein